MQISVREIDTKKLAFEHCLYTTNTREDHATVDKLLEMCSVVLPIYIKYKCFL